MAVGRVGSRRGWGVALAIVGALASACIETEAPPSTWSTTGLPSIGFLGVTDCSYPDDHEPPPRTEEEEFCAHFLVPHVVVEGTLLRCDGTLTPLARGDDIVAPSACMQTSPAVDLTLVEVTPLLGDATGIDLDQALVVRVPGDSTREWMPQASLDEDDGLVWSEPSNHPLEGAPLAVGARVVATLHRHPETGALAALDEIYARGSDGETLRQRIAWESEVCDDGDPVLRTRHAFIDSADFSSLTDRISTCAPTSTLREEIEMRRAAHAQEAIDRPSSHSAAACGGN